MPFGLGRFGMAVIPPLIVVCASIYNNNLFNNNINDYNNNKNHYLQASSWAAHRSTPEIPKLLIEKLSNHLKE